VSANPYKASDVGRRTQEGSVQVYNPRKDQRGFTAHLVGVVVK